MKKYFLKYFGTLMAICAPALLWSQTVTPPSQIKSDLTEPVAIFMVIIALLLLGVIAVLSKGIIIGTDVYRKNKMSGKATTLLLLALLASPLAMHAQDVEAEVVEEVVSTTIGGISKFSFYFLSGIIILEIIIILILLNVFYILLGNKKASEQTAEAKSKKVHWIERFNAAPASKGITDEELNMGHDFDGIQELDNPSPPWWRWGFVLSLVFAVVYLWIYEISGTGKNQYEELAYHTEEAEAAVKQYLAKSANNVDENTVTMLDNEGDIAAGKAIFVQICAACHAPDGGGNDVGPNLTDNYWLHGGSIKDVFKTIKYGVPEKGMKSWQDDYSPRQIAQLASFVKSLKGSTPAKPKAPQGDIFNETEGGDAPQETAPTETAKTTDAPATDSAK